MDRSKSHGIVAAAYKDAISKASSSYAVLRLVRECKEDPTVTMPYYEAVEEWAARCLDFVGPPSEEELRIEKERREKNRKEALQSIKQRDPSYEGAYEK